MKSFELDGPAVVNMWKYLNTKNCTYYKNNKKKKMHQWNFHYFFFISNQQRGARLSQQVEQNSYQALEALSEFLIQLPLNINTANQAEVTPCSYLQVTIVFKRLSNEIFSVFSILDLKNVNQNLECTTDKK